MRNSFVIFSTVACLCIHGIQLAQAREEIVQDTNAYCSADTHNETEVHTRRRRYLLFEKGAALSITAAAVKTIVSAIPRGLNLLCEETIYYDLPSSVAIPKIVSSTPQSTKSPSTKVEKKTKLMQKSSPTYPGYTPFTYKYKRNVPFTTSIDNFEGSYPNSLDIETLFFDQLKRISKLYGYNGQHCIMRTICEAQHLLYPRGQSLFHDIIRIILEFSLPTIRNNKKYFTASTTVNRMDCANFYGPHCKISFLDYFTVQIHGKFM